MKQFFSLRFWVNGLAGGAAIATFLSFLGGVWWGFSFLEHPRPQYCLLLLIGLLLSWLLPLIVHGRNKLTAPTQHSTLSTQYCPKIWLVLWCVALIINGALISPMYLGPGRRGLDAVAATLARPNLLSVVHVTLDRDNPDVSKVIRYLQDPQQEDAQLVSLLEVSPETLPRLQAGLDHYQLIRAEPRTNSHGSAWFVLQRSRQRSAKPIEVVGTDVIHLPETSDRPLLKATIRYAGKTIDLLCFHAIRPQNPGSVAYQQVELAALSNWSQAQLKSGKRHLIVTGDFNSTPWTATFRQTLQTSGLVNSMLGFGWQPTWPSSLPSVLQIPIDHCLHSPFLQSWIRGVGDNVGSDHLPLFVLFRL